MNTEQRLRHAAEEMERVTTSLTPPPITDVRRGARRRSAGAALVAAAGIAVLIGGAVLLLQRPAETTLTPAGPGEMVNSSADDAPLVTVVVFDLDPAPEFSLGSNAIEVPLRHVAAEDRDAELSVLESDPIKVPFAGAREVVALGASGDESLYVVRGVFSTASDPAFSGYGECVVAVGDGSIEGLGCTDSDARRLDSRVVVVADNVTLTMTGRAPEGASVIVLEVGDVRYWQRTQAGYAHLAVTASDEQRARYLVYDVAGNILEGTTIYTGVSVNATDATTAVAVENDGSCSGGLFFPDINAFGSLPESVRQTLGQITLFASRCWFEDLAAVGGDNFTASFGGMDPVELWTFEEEEGYEPMHHLMQILDMPHGTTEVSGRRLYIWPAAAAHDGEWTTVPEEDKAALRNLYDDEDFAGFESFGAYIGYRVGIYEDGDWSFFVAGD